MLQDDYLTTALKTSPKRAAATASQNNAINTHQSDNTAPYTHKLDKSASQKTGSNPHKLEKSLGASSNRKIAVHYSACDKLFLSK